MITPIVARIKDRRGKIKMANKDFGEWVDLVAETAKSYKAAKADGVINYADAVQIVPVLIKVPSAIAGSSVAFKDLSAADVKTAAAAILDSAGLNDGKIHIYIEEAFNIVAHAVGIVESVKKIQAA